MIQFQQFFLRNGLEVIVHSDYSSPLLVVNTLYKVGSRDETPDKTGFAHLFEHLMFSGSKHVENFDTVLEEAGGENNAFTTQDITNYYITLPACNIETALWLESDRMKSASINEESLLIQKSVVIEEFKEHYINQPYGDVWHKIYALAYKTHPYQWPTIGKEIAHIENATLSDVSEFYQRFYTPKNAILVLAGPIEIEQAKLLCNKWYSDIEGGSSFHRNIPIEPKQKEKNILIHKTDVPSSYIYKTFKMCKRTNIEYYTIDLISDLLGSGDSSRLTQQLVKNRQLFTTINAYVSGTLDEGLFVIEGRVADHTDVKEADNAIDQLLQNFCNTTIEEYELQKVKNQLESYNVLNDIDLLNRATNLAYYSYMGNINLINTEIDIYKSIDSKDIQTQATRLFVPENENTLWYLKNDSIVN